MKQFVKGWVVVLGLFFAMASLVNAQEASERLKRAVIKIHTTSVAPDFFTPWRMMNAQQSSGSGAVISGNRILTNAHVVANARYLQAQKNGDPRKYLAQVIFVSHEADLAVITVEDETFFNDIKPLVIVDLPDSQAEVAVFGYPFGGSSLSITKGILSRVEHQFYAHSSSYLLAGQIDAAINPGNSGGPVIVDGKIAGVVMQANTSNRAENLGYMVPPSVIKYVLKDAEDSKIDGFPDLGFRTQEMESVALKNAYSLNEKESGALVVKVFSDSSAGDFLQVNDVILKIDGFDIAGDQTISFRKNERTHFKYAIDRYQMGDTVPITISRGGKKQLVNIEVKPSRNHSLVQEERFDTLPRYFIYGGVVFVPLNMNLIKRWGNDWPSKAPIDFLHARNRWNTPEQKELVVALKVLPADVNVGYHDWKNWIIEEVNGKSVSTFKEFTDLVVSNEDPFVVLHDDDGFQMVINREDALKSEAEILQIYGVPSSHSAGLFN